MHAALGVQVRSPHAARAGLHYGPFSTKLNRLDDNITKNCSIGVTVTACHLHADPDTGITTTVQFRVVGDVDDPCSAEAAGLDPDHLSPAVVLITSVKVVYIPYAVRAS